MIPCVCVGPLILLRHDRPRYPDARVDVGCCITRNHAPGPGPDHKEKGPMSFPRDLVSTAYSSATLARPRLTIFGSLPPRIAHELLAGPTKFGGLAPTASLSFFFETWDLVSKVISIAWRHIQPPSSSSSAKDGVMARGRGDNHDRKG